jgi:hypothetical protein
MEEVGKIFLKKMSETYHMSLNYRVVQSVTALSARITDYFVTGTLLYSRTSGLMCYIKQYNYSSSSYLVGST